MKKPLDLDQSTVSIYPCCGAPIGSGRKPARLHDVEICPHCGLALTNGLGGLSVMTSRQEAHLPERQARILRGLRKQRAAGKGGAP
ncbi:MAG: hypothetical protein ACREEN_01640 [Stellaceae bacterium]